MKQHIFSHLLQGPPPATLFVRLAIDEMGETVSGGLCELDDDYYTDLPETAALHGLSGPVDEIIAEGWLATGYIIPKGDIARYLDCANRKHREGLAEGIHAVVGHEGSPHGDDCPWGKPQPR